MRPSMDVLDGVRAVFAAGATIYAFFCYHQFKGGKIAKSYVIFTVSGVVGTCAAVADFLGSDVAHDVLGIVFYWLLCFGFVTLHTVWKTLE